MKLQSLSIIFVLIILPIVLIISFYIQAEADTIALQTSYDTKLLDATYDAMSAFEMNTANEELSSVSDSLRSIIQASNSIFVKSMATSLGISNASISYIQPYVPAILYTLYDGYYIYTPTSTLDVKSNDDGTVCLDENGEMQYLKEDGTYTTNVNDPNLVYTTEYLLKTYNSYTSRYVRENGSNKIDVTINYTLDNYIIVNGSIGNVYYSKSGYLIEPSIVSEIKVDGVSYTNDENKVEELIKSGKPSSVKVEGKEISFNGSKTYDEYVEKLDEIKEKIAKLEFTNINSLNADTSTINSYYEEYRNLTYEFQAMNAVLYYAKSKIFSEWVYDNLKTIEVGDAIQSYMEGTQDIKSTNTNDTSYLVSFSGDSSKIFDVSKNPEDSDSVFATHKYNVIRNSIQYYLNLAFSNYNNYTSSSYDYKMPVMLDTEWAKITSNVSIVSFMQGLKCRLKTYNSYQVVSSTNNEISVTTDEIFYVPKDGFNDENSNYHRIDCERLIEESASEDLDSMELISFTSKEVKYDKVLDSSISSSFYKYTHKNLSCYSCTVDGNYDKQTESKKSMNYYKAVGAQRQMLYKTNAIPKNYGFETLFNSESSTYALSEISSIDVTFKYFSSSRLLEDTVRTITFGSDIGADSSVQYIIQSSAFCQTKNIPITSTNGSVHINIQNVLNSISGLSDGEKTGFIQSIKVNYK